jgi:tRNA (guanosine-2'-O-)-methyltransferase
MVQSLNVSVAAATLLFEALRQRERAGIVPSSGEGVPGGEEAYRKLLFEWAYPQVAEWCRRTQRPYPALSEEGEILESLPRTLKLRY